MDRVDTIDLFAEAGEARALLDVDLERVEVELLPPHDDSDDRVLLSVSADEECVHFARLSADQAIRVGRWLIAAGDAALGD